MISTHQLLLQHQTLPYKWQFWAVWWPVPRQRHSCQACSECLQITIQYSRAKVRWLFHSRFSLTRTLEVGAGRSVQHSGSILKDPGHPCWVTLSSFFPVRERGDHIWRWSPSELSKEGSKSVEVSEMCKNISGSIPRNFLLCHWLEECAKATLSLHDASVGGARERDSLIKCFPFKHEDLLSVPRSHVQKMHILMCTCNPSVEEVQTGRVLGLPGQPN